MNNFMETTYMPFFAGVDQFSSPNFVTQPTLDEFQQQEDEPVQKAVIMADDPVSDSNWFVVICIMLLVLVLFFTMIFVIYFSYRSSNSNVDVPYSSRMYNASYPSQQFTPNPTTYTTVTVPSRAAPTAAAPPYGWNING